MIDGRSKASVFALVFSQHDADDVVDRLVINRIT